MSIRKEKLLARFNHEATLMLLSEMKSLYDRAEWSSILAAQCLEKSVCEKLGVEYDFAEHNLIFTAFYIGEITAEQLVGGIAQ